jgi:undecaprenyl-diphosphatase
MSDGTRARPAPEPRLPADPATAGPLPAGRGAPAARASLAIFTGFVVLGACLVVFGSIAEGLRANEVFNLDPIATSSLHALATPGLDAVMNAITTLGASVVLVPTVVIACLLLIRAGRAGGALFLVVASLGSLLLNAVLKLFFERPRPIVPWAVAPTDFSFPSGHTMNSAVVYGALAVVVWSVAGRRAGSLAVALAIVLALAIGTSRIYLGYHYFADVVGGLLAAVSWLVIVVAAFRIPPLRRFWIVPPPAAASAPDRDRTGRG